MSYAELFADIYKRYKYHILFFLAVALIWSMFLFPLGFYTVSAESIISAPSALSLDSFGSSSAVLATSLMETIGVSVDPYTALTFIGVVSRLNEHFGWNLNIDPGLMQNNIIFIMVAILFLVTKISKCFGSTKALTMIHFSEIEKWVGLIFTALLSSSAFINFVTTYTSTSQAIAPIAILGTAATMGGIFSTALLTVTSVLITLLSWVTYYLVKMFFDFLDIITLPLTLIPGTTFLYEGIKTLGVFSVMIVIMLEPLIGLFLCLAIVIIAAVFFKKSYTAMLYFRKIYIKPFFQGAFGYSRQIPLVHKKFPAKLKKAFPNATITLALPVYNLKSLKSPLLKKYTCLWLICADHQMYLAHSARKKEMCFITQLSNVPNHPVYLKKSRRFYEIFCILPTENMNRSFIRIHKEYHLVLSTEYRKRLDEIYEITGYTKYVPYKKPKKRKQTQEDIQ